MQVVSGDCDTTSYGLQPTFSECLEYFEGDPCEDTRQSKKQKVDLHLAVLLGTEDVVCMKCVMLLRSLLWHGCQYQKLCTFRSKDASLQKICSRAVAL